LRGWKTEGALRRALARSAFHKTAGGACRAIVGGRDQALMLAFWA